jgi:hypothetical protein
MLLAGKLAAAIAARKAVKIKKPNYRARSRRSKKLGD